MRTTDPDLIQRTENEIDATFARSKLADVGYAQAVWTLLSVMEDMFWKRRRDASNAEELHVFTDVYINALTHPLRVCFNKTTDSGRKLRNTLIDDHYQFALDWIRAAKDYSQFCSLFSLWHRDKLTVALDGKWLLVERRDASRPYEAYNRVVRKEAKGDTVIGTPDEKLGSLLWAARSVNEDQFAVNFNPRLVSALVAWLAPVLDTRHSLPDDWHFVGFSLQQYRKIFLTVQSMLYGWNRLRDMLVQQGMPALGYRSSVWVVPKEELLARLVRYTGVERPVVATVLDLITFGSRGIRHPDVATQPLIALRNGTYALSPFIWLNTAAERNLCVLLNQIPEQKKRCRPESGWNSVWRDLR